MPGALQRRRGWLDPQDASQHLGAHAPEVVGSRSQVRVFDRLPVPGRGVDRALPRLGRRAVIRLDRSPGRREQRLVSEEQQVGGEDRRLLFARLGPDLVTLAFDVGGGFAPRNGRAARSRRPRRRRRRPGRVSAGTWKRWAGPLARPGDAEKPRRTPSSRSSSVTGSGGAARTAASGPPTSSSKFRDASASTAAIASAAWGPVAATSSSCPVAAPRVAIALRLFASAGPRPLVRSRTCTSASKEDAVCTNRAAGRACRPCGFATVIVVTTASPSGRSAAATHVGGRGAEVGDLAGEPAAGFSGHRVERGAHLRRDRGRHRAFDQRGLAQLDPFALLGFQQVEGHLGRQHRAAQVHQDEHAVLGPRAFDRLHHEDGVGADRVVGHVETAGGLETDVRPAHLARELGDAFGDAEAVGDDHDPDHDVLRSPSGPRGQHADQDEPVRHGHHAERHQSLARRAACDGR